MQTVFELFGRGITAYGLGCALAVLAGLIVLRITSARFRVPYSAYIRTACMAVPLILLMSRLIYVLANCTYYLTTLSKPMLALNFWDGGYSMMGAFYGLVLACCLGGGREYRIQLADSAGPAFLTGAGIERLFEAGTGMGLGRTIYDETLQGIPFCRAMDSTGAVVHAVYRYEALACLLLLITMLIVLEIMKKRLKGDVLLLTMTLYGSAQVLLESLRDDGHMVVHFVRIQQVLALLLVVAAMAVWIIRGRRKGIEVRRYILPVLLAAAGIGAAIWLEFRIDHSEDLIMDYGMMLLSLEALALGAILCHRLQMAKPEEKIPEGVRWTTKK